MIRLLDKQFELFLPQEQLAVRVAELGHEITFDYAQKQLYLLVVLSGAYRFAADLSAHISIPVEMGFVKVVSYSGMQSTGTMKMELEIPKNIEGKDVLIVEDIVDTGQTLTFLLNQPTLKLAKSVKIASLLTKPEALKESICVDYQGFEILNQFVVGYGLDYNGLGRNLNSIYKLKIS